MLGVQRQMNMKSAISRRIYAARSREGSFTVEKEFFLLRCWKGVVSRLLVDV